MRLFIGLKPNQEANRGISKLVKQWQKSHFKINWKDESKRHLTLAFLGDGVREEQIRRLEQIIKYSLKNIKPLELRFKGLGSFPDRLLPRTIWLSLKGDLQGLQLLVKRLRQNLKKAGFWLDERPILPHLTLGKVKPEISRKERLELGKMIVKNLEMEIIHEWRAEKVYLMESCLAQGGADYKTIGSYDIIHTDARKRTKKN